MWQMSSCCGADGITQVDVYGNDTTVGLAGLKQAFQQLYSSGVLPDASAAEELLARVRAVNYVPRTDAEQYKAALLREYAAFYKRKEQERRE